MNNLLNLDLILGMVLSALLAATKPKALEILQELKEKNEHDYKAVIFTLNAGAEHLKAVVDKTSTKLDDQGLADVQDILATSAQQNGISL
jgi:hypothetical protein